MDKSESINELATSLALFQSEVTDAERNATSYNGKYAELEQIFRIIRPLLSKNGLSFMQNLVSSNTTEIKIQTWIMHKSGQYIMSELTLPPASTGAKTNALHAVGISASYGKRYAIMGALGLCQKDESTEADELTDSGPKFKQAVATPEKQNTEVKMIGNPELIDLRKLILDSGGTEEKVCAHCKVNTLEDLTMASYEKMSKILFTKVLEKQEEKNKTEGDK